MIILVINCGSSSIKYQLYEMPENKVIAKGLVERIGLAKAGLTHNAHGEKTILEIAAPDHKASMEIILKTLTDPKLGVIKNIKEIGGIGHRVVHGGEAYSESVLIDAEVVKCVEDFCDLAPLHNPPNLTGIRSAQSALPGVPNVAVFDTAFHQTMPRHAYLYAIPYDLYKKYRVRKYGFHGTSHAYLTRRASHLLGIPQDQISLVTCHLGNGASVACVENGKSIDTSMGLTPLQGLVMGTRSGDIDPAIIPYLMGKEEFSDYRKIDKMLNKESGLLGLSGVSSDMRDIETAAAKDGLGSRAQLALDVFSYRLKFYIGAYMAVLKRIDAIVFSGGVGENGSAVRWAACSSLANLGVYIDPLKNKEMIRGKEGDISAPQSHTKVLVIPTDEEGFIAAETYRLTQG